MKHVGKILASLALGAILLGGSAFAAVPMTFVDEGVDYNDDATTTAYISLSMDGGTLVVTLDDAAGGSSLPAVAFDVPAVDRYDFFGNDLGAELAAIDEVSVATTGATLTSLEVTHLGMGLRELADTYLGRLVELGFEATVDIHTNHNFATLEASNEDGSLRVVLHRSGDGVDAHLFRL